MLLLYPDTCVQILSKFAIVWTFLGPELVGSPAPRVRIGANDLGPQLTGSRGFQF